METSNSANGRVDRSVRAHDDEADLRICAALTAIAGIDSFGVDLRDDPEAWAALERFRREERDACMLHLFDGYRVYCTLTDAATKRTSYENVSDTLDALAKLMRSNA